MLNKLYVAVVAVVVVVVAVAVVIDVVLYIYTFIKRNAQLSPIALRSFLSRDMHI